MPLPPTYKFRSIPALIGLYTKFGSDPGMANGAPNRFHQAVCKTAIAPERCIIAPFILKGSDLLGLLANRESSLLRPVQPPVDGMKVSAAPSPGRPSALPGRSENFPASRRAYRDDGCGPCESAPVSGAPAFSPGAGSNGASVQLFPFGFSYGLIFSHESSSLPLVFRQPPD